MPTVVQAPYDNVSWETELVLQTVGPTTPVEFKVSREAAKMSGLLKDMLEDHPGGACTVIPVCNVDGRTLEYVVEYMEYHVNHRPNPIEKPLRGKIDAVICDWDKNFLYRDLVRGGDEKQHQVLIDVIMAANFLNVKDLLDLTCATVASMIKGKTTEQMRTLFNIRNDFSPEEEQKLREENSWCEEPAESGR